MNNPEKNPSRRHFLQTGAVAATGALLLGALETHADDAAPAENKTQAVLKLSEHGQLGKVGGFEVITTPTDKIIVARTGDATFVACSAVCPHRRCAVEYQHEAKQFVCPCHDSRFDLDGKVTHGPAKTDLKKYGAQPALEIDSL